VILLINTAPSNIEVDLVRNWTYLQKVGKSGNFERDGLY